MSILKRTTKVNSVLANVTSMVLCDPTGAYGVKRNDTSAVIVAANIAMTNSATGTYTYTVTTVGGVAYTAWIKRTYRGQVGYKEVIWTAAGDTTALTGLTLKELIYTILANDANLTGSGNLGTLLGYNAVSKPETVFYNYPPERIKTPIITYRMDGAQGRWPKNITLDIVVWGGNFDAIHDRVFDLLNERIELTPTDWSVKGIFFESEGPELWDENLKCYFQRKRYRIEAIKI